MNKQSLVSLLQPATHQAAVEKGLATIGTARATFKTYTETVTTLKPYLTKAAIVGGGLLGVVLAIQATEFLGSIPGTSVGMQTIGFVWLVMQALKFFQASGREEMAGCLGTISSSIFGESESVDLPVLHEPTTQEVHLSAVDPSPDVQMSTDELAAVQTPKGELATELSEEGISVSPEEVYAPVSTQEPEVDIKSDPEPGELTKVGGNQRRRTSATR